MTCGLGNSLTANVFHEAIGEKSAVLPRTHFPACDHGEAVIVTYVLNIPNMYLVVWQECFPRKCCGPMVEFGDHGHDAADIAEERGWLFRY